jgi:hypothetical protein
LVRKELFKIILYSKDLSTSKLDLILQTVGSLKTYTTKMNILHKIFFKNLAGVFPLAIFFCLYLVRKIRVRPVEKENKLSFPGFLQR